MELLLKKYFWVVHVAVIALCALLAAKALNHVIEGKWLLGADEPPRAQAGPKPARKPDKPRTTATKDGDLVATRDVFCSTCAPVTPEPAAIAAAASDPNHPPYTSLPLALLATSVARVESFSSATVANTQSNRSGAYWLHEEIPEAGEIVRIEPRYVDFKNRSTNRVERIDLLGAAAPPPAARPAAAPATPPPAAGGDSDLLAALDKGVKKVSDTSYEIDRALVDKVLADPNLVARSARIVPSIKDGKANGFKMYAIRPNSVYAKIGFQNGDTLHSVNGFEITSPDKALEVYTKVKSASSLSIQITRRGQPVTLEYSIR